ncbi:MAG: hypothetical protein R3F53_25475 [Gammaproteobacteria bacterium]
MPKRIIGVLPIILLSATVQADNVALDDQIIQSSQCIGFDCVNGEDFNGGITLRLKANNTRIHFLDTSNSAAFPSTDWQLTANDSTNNGRNRFSIEDVTASVESFTIMGGAPDFSVFIQGNGNVGMGTDDPQRAMHVIKANTPAIRLEQGGGTFPAAVWDIQANEQGLSIALDGTPQLEIDSSGNLTIQGSLTTTNPAGTFPDYVFVPGYSLMPLEQLSAFVSENGHLPDIPSAAQTAQDGLNMSQLQLKLLQKVEELTLYTLQQQAQIEALQAQLHTVE